MIPFVRCEGKFMILFVSERKTDGCISELSAHLSKLETGCKLNLKRWRKGKKNEIGKKSYKENTGIKCWHLEEMNKINKL